MKIALVCPYNMFEHSGGVQNIVLHLADGLRAKKHDVRIITPRPVGFKGETPKGFIFLGNSRRLNGTFSTVLDVGIEVDGNEISKVLEQEKFDVINFHEPWYPVLSRQIAMRSENSAHVATFHAILPDSMAAKSIVNLLMPYGKSITERMHLLTATGPAAASVLLSKGTSGRVRPELLENLKYIPPAIDQEFYKPFKKRASLHGAGTKTIVYIGRPDKRKGVDWLLRAFGELVQEMPDAHLVIAGDGDRLSVLKKIVKAEKIPNVTFPGRVSDEEKRRLLGNADLACFPSLYGEGFGIVLMEAMAMGTPLLAGNNVGYQTVMKGTGRICLVDPEATQDFANRLAVFLTDPSLQHLLADWGLREVKQYNYPDIVAQYESAFKEALQIFKNGQPKLAKEKDGTKRRKVFGWLAVRRHAR